jgi:hypothetical protein
VSILVYEYISIFEYISTYEYIHGILVHMSIFEYISTYEYIRVYYQCGVGVSGLEVPVADVCEGGEGGEGGEDTDQACDDAEPVCVWGGGGLEG